jgi:hypothetical protein
MQMLTLIPCGAVDAAETMYVPHVLSLIRQYNGGNKL